MLVNTEACGMTFKPLTMMLNDKEYTVERLSVTHTNPYDYSDSNVLEEFVEVTARRMRNREDFYGRYHKECKCAYRITVKPNRVICNGPVTVVLWNDNTKTVVRLAEGDKNCRRTALLYAYAKKKFGNNSRIHKEIDSFCSSNAQRIALLNYIIAKDGVNLDDIMEHLILE